MKIMVVHETFGRMAGAEQNILVTAPRLREDFTLCGLFSQRSGKDEARFAELFPAHALIDFEGPPALVRQDVAEFLRRESPDLVYVHKCIALPVLEALVASGLPLVRMEHDHDIYCMRRYKYFPWNRRICTRKAGLGCLFPCLAFLGRDRSRGRFGMRWISYRRQMACIRLNLDFAAYFVVTRYMRDELIRQGFPPDRVHVFPPIPVPQAASFEPTFSNRNLVLFVGQIIRGKGLDVLLRSLALCRQPLHLVVLGSGSHQATCERLVQQLGLADRVEFPGFVSQETLASYYRDATLVAIPSVWPEPIATVGLEVLRYGLPVVGFDAGGMCDWLRDGETGFLVPWMDIRTMAQKIDFLLEHKEEARRLGRQGREFVNCEFDFEAYIARMKAMFRQLAAASTHGQAPA